MISLKVILQAKEVASTHLITGFQHGSVDRLLAPVVPDIKATVDAAVGAVADVEIGEIGLPAIPIEPPLTPTAFSAALENAERESITQTTAVTTVETSVATAPPGAAPVKVVTSSTNQTSSSVTSGTGGGGVDRVTGGPGRVQVTVRVGAASILAPERIRDFRSISRAANNSTATSLEELAAAVFADADGLQAGNQALRRGAAALVRATGAEIRGTYLLVNNGNRRLDPADDLMVRLTGFSGRLPAVGAIDPASVFG